MSVDKKHLKNIINANNDNSLAIFVGAGISMSSNTKSFKMPSWNDLVQDLKNELDDEKESDYLKLAQLYYLAFGEYTYYKKLKEYFPDYIKPSEVHKLIFDINPHIIITTNWDNILERTIEDNAYIYDVICSDSDLVKSSLQNKLIKMHGDFKNHNIVFKEDDYINYQHDFPLIENYVKSILSTHTVLFLGYSYNDINLKQILNWIKNHSDVRPPMYLTVFEDKPTQSKYLDNHGITTLLLTQTEKNDFVPDGYSNRTFTFLNRIKKLDESKVITSKLETTDFIYNKLSPLNDLDSILLEQIQRTLSNCGFIYDGDSKPILEFYNNQLTGDYNKSIRNVFKSFIEILKEVENGKKPTHKLKKIFEILRKGGVKGIVISEDDMKNHSKEYIPFANYIEQDKNESSSLYFDFDFNDIIKSSSEIEQLFDLAFKLYQLERIDESFSTIEEIISACLKQRNYTLLFIAMFNRNILLRRLKYGFDVDREKYTSLEEYKLKERYFNLPKDLQQALEPIYNFVDISFLYKYAYEMSVELRKKEDSKRTIESGGFVFNSDINKLSAKQENLVLFVLRNKIMIESFNEFQSINKQFVEIAIIRQIQKEKTTFNKTELFSAIKYISYKELKLLLKDFYDKDSNKKGKFEISIEDKTWLINSVFDNIVHQFLQSTKIFGKFEKYIENVLFLLSISQLEKNEIDSVLEKIGTIISKGNNTLGIFQSINLFFGIQYNLYKTEIEEKILLSLIENLINKLVYKKFNGHEYIALTRNELSNLYGYARERKTIVKDKALIEKLIKEVEGYSITDKIEISQNLLLNIYGISNKPIKEIIKKFILNIKSTEEKEDYKRIVFELTLIIYELKIFDKSILNDMKDYMKQFEDGKMFSSALYMIDSQVEFLYKNKGVNELNEILDVIKSVISRYEKSERLSIF